VTQDRKQNGKERGRWGRSFSAQKKITSRQERGSVRSTSTQKQRKRSGQSKGIGEASSTLTRDRKKSGTSLFWAEGDSMENSSEKWKKGVKTRVQHKNTKRGEEGLSLRSSNQRKKMRSRMEKGTPGASVSQ